MSFDTRCDPHLYQSPEGTTIYVAVPWSDGSGMIPPPTITFGTERGPVVFAYVGNLNE